MYRIYRIYKVEKKTKRGRVALTFNGLLGKLGCKKKALVIIGCNKTVLQASMDNDSQWTTSQGLYSGNWKKINFGDKNGNRN
ncbi:unnamed protein product [Absidia cylindrospora]